MKKEIINFINWEQASRDTIDFKKSYVDIADDLIAGLLLSQIVYWHLPSRETNKTKLRVEKEGHLWIAKGRADWWDEIRLSPTQFDRASKVLVKKGIIEKKTFKFNGNPTIHVRLIWDEFLLKLDEIIYGKVEENSEKEEENEQEALGGMVIDETLKRKLMKGEEGYSRNIKKEIDESLISLTESTTEITPKITSENVNDLSIYEREIKEIDIPDELKITIQKRMDRLIFLKINLKDIERNYKANSDVLNKWQYAEVLETVLVYSKKEIKHFNGYINKAIHDYLHPKQEEQLNRSNNDNVPDWFKNGEHLKKRKNPKKMAEELTENQKKIAKLMEEYAKKSKN